MTKLEKTLRDQIKELERLVEIKDAVIIELKTLIRPAFQLPYITTTSPTIYGPNGAGSSSGTVTITDASDSNRVFTQGNTAGYV